MGRNNKYNCYWKLELIYNGYLLCLALDAPEKPERQAGCFLKIKQGLEEMPADFYRAQYQCEGCLRRKTLLKNGKKPTVSTVTLKFKYCEIRYKIYITIQLHISLDDLCIIQCVRKHFWLFNCLVSKERDCSIRLFKTILPLPLIPQKRLSKNN